MCGSQSLCQGKAHIMWNYSFQCPPLQTQMTSGISLQEYKWTNVQTILDPRFWMPLDNTEGKGNKLAFEHFPNYRLVNKIKWMLLLQAIKFLFKEYLFIWAALRGMQDLSFLTSMEPVCPGLEAESLNHWAARKSPIKFQDCLLGFNR